jgi:dTDP-4-amino-4,6-dideoxygalactose transaminase
MTVRIFDHEDLAAVKRVLDSGDLCSVSGTVSREFEEAFAQMIGCKRAVAVNSGMAALHCAVYAAGAGAGDEVICDSMVQFGSMAAIYNNAVPVFADVQRDTHLIDPESVRQRITPRTKAIICTHLWGLPCDMDPIMQIAAEHGLAVIEDNAHALFAEYKGRVTGTLGHMAEFSFQMSKQLALGDAGMVTTTEERFVEGLVDGSGIRGLATFPKMMWNYRLNEVVAAIGLVQLKRARGYVESAIANAQPYEEAIRGVEWIRPQRVPGDRKHSYHIWGAAFEGDRFGITRERFVAAIEAAGVNINVGYIQKAPYLYDTYTVPLAYGRGCPMHCPLQLREMNYRPGLCPVAEDLMPRLMITGTVGTLAMHQENAARLREAIAQFN